MSVAAVQWVREHSRSKGNARVLAFVIADHVNGDGRAWLKFGTLLRETNASERTVQEAKRELQRLGELRVEPYGGPGRSDVYHLVRAAEVATLRVEESATVEAEGGKIDHPRVAESATLRVATSAAVYKEEPSVEPSLNQRTPPTPPPAIGDVWDAYLTARATIGLTTTLKLTPNRRDKIRARLRTNPLADVLDAAQGWTRDPWPDRRNHCDATVIFRNDEQVEKFRDLWRNGPPPTLSKTTATALRTYQAMRQQGAAHNGTHDLRAVDRARRPPQHALPPPADRHDYR